MPKTNQTIGYFCCLVIYFLVFLTAVFLISRTPRLKKRNDLLMRAKKPFVIDFPFSVLEIPPIMAHHITIHINRLLKRFSVFHILNKHLKHLCAIYYEKKPIFQQKKQHSAVLFVFMGDMIVQYFHSIVIPGLDPESQEETRKDVLVNSLIH